MNRNSYLESEVYILSNLLGSSQNHNQIQGISEDFFTDFSNKKIFRAIRTSYEQSQKVTVERVGRILEKSNSLEFIGGINHLSYLACQGLSADFSFYVERLRENLTKTSLISLLDKVTKELREEHLPQYTIIENLIEEINRIKRKRERFNASKWEKLLIPTTEESCIEECLKEEISTSYYVDNSTPIVLETGALSVVAGCTGHGKTTFLQNIVINYLEEQTKSSNPKEVIFFSYEESRTPIIAHFLNIYCNMFLSNSNKKTLTFFLSTKNEKERYKYFCSEFDKKTFEEKKEEFFKKIGKNLHVFYNNMSVQDLIESIHYVKKIKSIGLVVIDYFQLLDLKIDSKKSKPESRQAELKKICHLLKNCAVETGLPILLASQFNREVKSEKDLSLTSLGEAGDIERISHLVIGMWNRNFQGFSKDRSKEKNSKKSSQDSTIYIEILKGRTVGVGGKAILKFEGNSGKLHSNKNWNFHESLFSW